MTKFIPEFGFALCLLANLGLALSIICDCLGVPTPASTLGLGVSLAATGLAAALLTRPDAKTGDVARFA